MTLTVEKAKRQLAAAKRYDEMLATQSFVVVSKSPEGATLYLTRAGRVYWTQSRADAIEFPTWRKARNAARKHNGLTSPARLHQ